MGGQNTAPQVPTLAVGETRNFAVSFINVLDSGELLTGTPTVAEATTADLTIASKVVNTAALTVDDTAVAIGQAVQFKVSGQQLAHSPYTLKITVGTNATPAQTLVRFVKFLVASE
jgi:hypothetical protein